MPRACPSFSVERALTFTKVSSTAASMGRQRCTTSSMPAKRATSLCPIGSAASGLIVPQATKERRAPSQLDDAPAEIAEAGV